MGKFGPILAGIMLAQPALADPGKKCLGGGVEIFNCVSSAREGDELTMFGAVNQLRLDICDLGGLGKNQYALDLVDKKNGKLVISLPVTQQVVSRGEIYTTIEKSPDREMQWSVVTAIVNRTRIRTELYLTPRGEGASLVGLECSEFVGD